MKCKKFSFKQISKVSASYELNFSNLGLKNKKTSRIHKYAERLKNNTPNSEVWFQSLWPFKDDSFNEVFGKRIPDVLNRKYKYIIEIDGTIHNTKDQKKIDKYKDFYYKSKGYAIFRVIAYNQSSYDKVLEQIKKIRLC